MAHQITIIRRELDGDVTREQSNTKYTPSYDTVIEQWLELAAGVKKDVPLPAGISIEHLYLESMENEEIQVFKNLSPEFWAFSHIFQVFDTDISQLALKSATATTVHIWIGGSA